MKTIRKIGSYVRLRPYARAAVLEYHAKSDCLDWKQ
jgi:hypothetical protein